MSDTAWTRFFKSAVKQAMAETPMLMPDTTKMIIINSVLYLGGGVSTVENPANQPFFAYLNNHGIILRDESGRVKTEQLLGHGKIWQGIALGSINEGEVSIPSLVTTNLVSENEDVINLLEKSGIDSQQSRVAANRLSTSIAAAKGRC